MRKSSRSPKNQTQGEVINHVLPAGERTCVAPGPTEIEAPLAAARR